LNNTDAKLNNTTMNPYVKIIGCNEIDYDLFLQILEPEQRASPLDTITFETDQIIIPHSRPKDLEQLD
jgi:hypothetical protein